MTICVPLGHSPQPHHSRSARPPLTEIDVVVQAVVRAKRILVVTGAGISVHAGIPDFRSPSGLFKSLKRDNPREGLSSGKDLFHASVFGSEQTTTIFYQMIAKLSELSVNAEPTPFHSLLRTLDQRGQLLRMYTQNIDALEEKAGLSFGVPSCLDKPRAKRSRLDDGSLAEPTPVKDELPKCVPLHGTLQHMHCTRCSYSEPIASHIETLHSGSAPLCPSCTSIEVTRGAVGKRPRGVGRLRPSVVLYGEEHREGERVGAVVQRDLTGKGKGNRCGDLLIVAGTSLRVPGTRRIVREFSKSVKSLHHSSKPGATVSGEPSRYPPSPTPSPDPSQEEENSPIRTIFVNYEFPSPSREWDGVFDVWVKGDAQLFAEKVVEALHVRDERLAKRRKASSGKGTYNPTIDLSTPATTGKASSGMRTHNPTTGLFTPATTPKKKRKYLDDSSPCPDRSRKTTRERSASPSRSIPLRSRDSQSSDFEDELLDLFNHSRNFLYPMRPLDLRTRPTLSSVRSTAAAEDSEVEVDESLEKTLDLPSLPSFGFRRARLPSPPPSPIANLSPKSRGKFAG